MAKENNRNSDSRLRRPAIAGVTAALFATMQGCGPAINTKIKTQETEIERGLYSDKEIEDIISDARSCEAVSIDYNRESIRTNVNIDGRDYQLWIPADDFETQDSNPTDTDDPGKRVKLIASNGPSDLTIEAFCYNDKLPGKQTPFENSSVVTGFVASNREGENFLGVKVRDAERSEFYYSRKIEDELTSVIVPVKFNGEIIKYNYLFKKTEEKNGFEISTAIPGTKGAKEAERLAIITETDLEGKVETVMAFDQAKEWMDWMGKTRDEKEEKQEDQNIEQKITYSGGENNLEYKVEIDDTTSILLLQREEDKREYSIKGGDRDNPLTQVGDEFESASGERMIMLKKKVNGTPEYFEVLLNPNDVNDAEIFHRESDRGEFIVGQNMIFNPETETFKPLKVSEGEDIKVYIQDIRPGKETYGRAVRDWVFYTIGSSSPEAKRKITNYVKTKIIEESRQDDDSHLSFNDRITKNSPLVSDLKGGWALYIGNPFSVFGEGKGPEKKVPEPVINDNIKAGVTYHQRTGPKSSRQAVKYDYGDGLDLTPEVDYSPVCRMRDGCAVDDVIDEDGESILIDGAMSFNQSDDPHKLKYVITEGEKTYHKPVDVTAEGGMCSAVHYKPGNYDEEYCGDLKELDQAVESGDECKDTVYRSDHRTRCWCRENKGKCALAITGTVLTVIGGAILFGDAVEGNGIDGFGAGNNGGQGAGMYDVTDPTSGDSNE